MKKIIILFTVLLLTGCGVGTTRNSKNNSQPVSYTHLDVYKRQILLISLSG